MENLSLITYSNSNMEDVWEAHFNQIKKHFKSNSKIYFISDKHYENPVIDKTFIYKNSEPYYKAWLNCLENISEDYFIYLQEDLILYDDVQIENLKKYISILENNKNFDFIRLIKSGKKFSDEPFLNELYYVNKSSFPQFSMQPTIWKKSRFIELYKKVQAEKWFESEDYEKACNLLNIKGFFTYSGEKKRGGHFDSNIYPYIATAVIKGKWNISEYKHELKNIFKTYNIDPAIRGKC